MTNSFILKTICRPFDPQYYEDEFEDEEMLDEGSNQVKIKGTILCFTIFFFLL